jgi:hypothetical protein
VAREERSFQRQYENTGELRALAKAIRRYREVYGYLDHHAAIADCGGASRIPWVLHEADAVRSRLVQRARPEEFCDVEDSCLRSMMVEIRRSTHSQVSCVPRLTVREPSCQPSLECATQRICLNTWSVIGQLKVRVTCGVRLELSAAPKCRTARSTTVTFRMPEEEGYKQYQHLYNIWLYVAKHTVAFLPWNPTA